MKLYGIFDNNNILIRYSNVPQESSTYEKTNYPLPGYTIITEHCLPNIEYSLDYIGKYYDVSTDSFSEKFIN